MVVVVSVRTAVCAPMRGFLARPSSPVRPWLFFRMSRPDDSALTTRMPIPYARSSKVFMIVMNRFHAGGLRAHQPRSSTICSSSHHGSISCSSKPLCPPLFNPPHLTTAFYRRIRCQLINILARKAQPARWSKVLVSARPKEELVSIPSSPYPFERAQAF